MPDPQLTEPQPQEAQAPAIVPASGEAEAGDAIHVDDRPSRRSRNAIRMRARAKVECRVGMSGMSPNIATQLVNVSTTGALIAVKSPVEDNRAVELRFTGPEDRHSTIVVARTVRCDPFQAGSGFYLGVKFEKPMSGPDVNKLVHSGKVVEG